MTSGFGAIPDELRQTAGRIVDVVGAASGMPWRGPSGDYGHPGVQAGWAQFVEDLKAQVEKLHDKAHGHGDDLKAAASKYLESDEAVGGQLGGIGELVDSLPGGAGIAGGGISHVLNGEDGAVRGSGFVNPEVAARLDPGSAGGAPAGRNGESGGQSGGQGEGPLY